MVLRNTGISSCMTHRITSSVWFVAIPGRSVRDNKVAMRLVTEASWTRIVVFSARDCQHHWCIILRRSSIQVSTAVIIVSTGAVENNWCLLRSGKWGGRKRRFEGIIIETLILVELLHRFDEDNLTKRINYAFVSRVYIWKWICKIHDQIIS